MQKTDVQTAARILGISEDAVRKRIKRGSITAEKDKLGRWYVFIEDNPEDISGQEQDNSGQLIEQLRSENDFLRQQLQQKDIILYNLTEGIKLLKAPQEEEEQAPARPWWRRLFRR